MLKLKSMILLMTVFFLGLETEVMTPGNFVRTANADTHEVENKVQVSVLSTEEIWKSVYMEVQEEEIREENSKKMILAFAVEEMVNEELELQLMSSATDHIVNYHGEKYAITDDEYQVLLRIVEAEATGEDVKGKMLVANVVLNRLDAGFGGKTISEVVFAENQFAPIKDGRYFEVTITEATVEAVERVLDGEDESCGALYFKSLKRASTKGTRWFEKNLKYLFTYGGHQFYTEKY